MTMTEQVHNITDLPETVSTNPLARRVVKGAIIGAFATLAVVVFVKTRPTDVVDETPAV